MSVFNLDQFFPMYYTLNESRNYYDLEEDYFYNLIPNKKEYDDLRMIPGDPSPKVGIFLKHQAFLSRFMSPYTPVDRILVFHKMGSGKTAVIAAITEFAIRVNKGEISNNEIIILVRNPNLRKAMIREIAFKFSNGRYLPEDIDDLSQETINKRINKAMGIHYKIETFTSFTNEIKLLTDNEIKSRYSNRYVLIDEAHNIRLRKVKTKGEDKSASNYLEISRFIKNSLGSKIILLTATPAKDKPSEIAQTLNLILKEEDKFDIKTFEQDYFEESSRVKPEMMNDFKSRIRGMVSYLRTDVSDIKIYHAGNVDKSMSMIFTKTLKIEMEPFQAKIYRSAYEKEARTDGVLIEDVEDDEDSGGSEKSTIWKNSIQASLCVYPDGTYYKDDVLYYEDRGIFRPTPKLINFITSGGKSLDNMLSNLKKLSIKYYYVIREIFDEKNKGQKFFVYSNVVTSGGALLFSALLEVFGMVHAPIPSRSQSMTLESMGRNPNRYITLTGSTTSSNQNDILINQIFNKKENRYGDYIRVIIGSHVVGEGLSFYHIRKVFILTPYWNNASTEQAIARAIRYKSHDDLPKEEQNLIVYRLVSDYIGEIEDETQSIDAMMYKISEDKDIKIKAIERLMKESAVDCSLNYKRNVLANDQPYTQECDYLEECNYKCDYIEDEYTNNEWVGERLVDTYNLYYGEKEIEEIKEIVSEIYLYKSMYDFEEIYNVVLSRMDDIPPIILARALNEIIMYNMPVYNRMGFENYLREDRNLYFLVDSPFVSSIFTSSYYSSHPEPITNFDSIDDMLKYWHYENIDNVIEMLRENEDDLELIRKILSNLPDYIVQDIVEIFIIAKVKKSPANKVLQNVIYKLFETKIIQQDKKVFLTIDKDNIKRMKKEGDDYIWISASSDDISRLGEAEKKKKTEIKEKGCGYIGYIVMDEKTGDETFKIETVKESRLKEEGTVDKRVEKKGLTCGTGKMKYAGLAEVYWNLMKRGIENGKGYPDMKLYTDRNKTVYVKYTIDNLLKETSFKKYLSERILFDSIDEELIQEAAKFDPEDLLPIFIDVYKTSGDKEEEKEMKNILSRYTGKKKEEDIPKFTIDMARGLIRATSGSKGKLVNKILGKDWKTYKERFEGIERDVLEKMSEEELSSLGGFFEKKSPQVCAIMQEWFKKNNLIGR